MGNSIAGAIGNGGVGGQVLNVRSWVWRGRLQHLDWTSARSVSAFVTGGASGSLTALPSSVF